MILRDLLRKENNNLDIFRLLAAYMVIYAHSYPLLSISQTQDPLFHLTNYEDTGGLAVKIFFFLSGLLVTNSLLTKKNIISFIISRFCRIYPALFFLLFITTFIIGPMFSTYSLYEYYSIPLTYVYFLHNMIFKTSFFLPGLFAHNPYTLFNGSLWTLPIEVSCYIVLGIFYLIGGFKFKPVCIIITGVIIIDPIFDNHLLITWFAGTNHSKNLLAPCFALGCLIALYKDYIKINFTIVIAAVLFFFVSRQSAYNFYFFYLCIFILILYISSLKIMTKIKFSVDISYGVYLWSFPIQQIMVLKFIKNGLLFNQISTIIIASCFGLLSWHLIEKKGIKTGQYINKKINMLKKL